MLGSGESTATLITGQTVGGWIDLDGTGTIAISDSYNVSSITDEATGSWSVNWDADCDNANYALTGMCEDQNYGGTVSIWGNSAKAAGTVRLSVHDGGGSGGGAHTQVDADVLCLIAFGDF